ncbi:MAG TPA: flippase-like domain-containing protein [Nitrospinaceae bacterium]|nr:flippase-like domain-containing protein [Nitrospinaceae bacterium]
MKKTRQLLIGLTIAFGALYYTLRNISLDELIMSFKELELLYILPAFGIIILTYVIRAYRWKILLRPFKQVPIKDIYAPLMIGFMGNILPARAGEFLRAYLLGKKQGITFSGAFSTIIMERLFDLICLLALFVWVFVVNVDMVDPQLTFSGVSVQSMLNGFGQFCGVLVAGLLCFMFLLVYKEENVRSCVSWLIRPLLKTWKEKIFVMMGEFALGCKIIKDFSALIKIIFLSVVLWTLLAATYVPFYYAYDLQDKSLDSVLLLTVMVCVLITILPTPGFIGSFNAGVLIALHKIMGEDELIAVSFGMVVWTAGFIVLIAGGLFFVFKDHLSVQSLINVEEEVEPELEPNEIVSK